LAVNVQISEKHVHEIN